MSPSKDHFIHELKLEYELGCCNAIFETKHYQKKVFVSERAVNPKGQVQYISDNKEENEEWVFLSVEQPTFTSGEVTNISVEKEFGFLPPFIPLKSFCLLQILKNITPDLVVFEGSPGLAYYSLLSKTQGQILQQTVFKIYKPEFLAQRLENMHQFPAGRTDIELTAIERDSLHRFDWLVEDDEIETIKWARAAGWVLPQNIELKKPTDFSSSYYQKIDYREVSALNEMPFISICMATYNRPELLASALNSLASQSFVNFEVIVVDDGSDTKCQANIAKLEEEYRDRGWRFYSQLNSGPAAARNYAASLAKGSHLLFMDDDNLALTHEIEMFSKAVQYSDADIFTCIPGWHPESELKSGLDFPLKTEDPQYSVVTPDWIPVGGFKDLGVFINCFGDNNALYRKKTFDDLGGFQGDRAFVMEDMQLFIRAVNEGHRLEVIPEVLFLYRKHAASRSLKEAVYSSHVKTLEPYKELVDPSLWPLLLCLRKGFYDRHSSISSMLKSDARLNIGEWVRLSNENKKVTVIGGKYDKSGWVPSTGARLSFLLNSAGKKHSLIFECDGPEKIYFKLSGFRYSIESGSLDPSLVECLLNPGAVQSIDDTVLEFEDVGNTSLIRFAVVQQDF